MRAVVAFAIVVTGSSTVLAQGPGSGGAVPTAPGAPPTTSLPPPLPTVAGASAPTAAGPDPNLPSAGGLTAPGPMAPEQPPPAGETQAHLDASASEDSGRGLTWFWLDVDGGFQHVGLETFKADRASLTAGMVPTKASGGYVGAGLGLQLLYFRIGPRARVGFFDNWQMVSVGGEVGLRIPLGAFEPHLEFGGGYVSLGNLQEGGLAAVADKAEISGAYGRIGAGFDIFVGKVISVGPFASLDVMGLKRPGVSVSELDPGQANSLDEAQKTALALEGAGYGASVSIGGRLGLSF